MIPPQSPPPPGRIPLDVLDRYLAGDCSPAEAESVARWMERDREHRALVDALRAGGGAAAPAPSSWDVDQMWKTISERRLRSRVAPHPRPRRVMHLESLRRRTPVASRLAAAAVVAIAAGLLWEGSHRAGDRRPTEAPWREYATARGQRASFDLADGTHVRLSVDSRLRVPPDFGERTREVSLEGEALFDVRHDPAKPFRVRTTRVAAEDIGTKFVVRAYATDREATVVVADGVVALAPVPPSPSAPSGEGGGNRATPPAGPPLVLGRGELGRVSTTGEVTTEQGVAVDAYLAWADGRLVFKRVPLRDALPQLDRWYDLHFQLADDSIGGLLLTASFDDAPPGEAIELLAMSLGVRYERHGNVVTFHARRGR
jgi:transmembrane sensor